MLGITFKGAVGLGDKLQFASFPENHFRNTGEKVVDVDRVWIFDHNPYVVRDAAPTEVIDLWTHPWPQQTTCSHEQYLAKPIFSSLAERTATIFNQVAYLKHPRLYRFEDLPRLEKRVVLHTTGKSLPPPTWMGEDSFRVLTEEIIEHVRKAYKSYEIIQIGAKSDLDAHVIDRRGLPDIWDVVRIIAQAGTYIGVDSGPYWIAACYPRIFRKKILMQFPPDHLRKHFVPMHLVNPHAHWHDASCYYYNRSADDAGITYSYLKL